MTPASRISCLLDSPEEVLRRRCIEAEAKRFPWRFLDSRYRPNSGTLLEDQSYSSAADHEEEEDVLPYQYFVFAPKFSLSAYDDRIADFWNSATSGPFADKKTCLAALTRWIQFDGVWGDSNSQSIIGEGHINEYRLKFELFQPRRKGIEFIRLDSDGMLKPKLLRALSHDLKVICIDDVKRQIYDFEGSPELPRNSYKS